MIETLLLVVCAILMPGTAAAATEAPAHAVTVALKDFAFDPSRVELRVGEVATRSSMGVEIQPGGEVTLRFTVPASATGAWEMGCFFPGHFETGMKGILVIE